MNNSSVDPLTSAEVAISDALQREVDAAGWIGHRDGPDEHGPWRPDMDRSVSVQVPWSDALACITADLIDAMGSVYAPPVPSYLTHAELERGNAPTFCRWTVSSYEVTPQGLRAELVLAWKDEPLGVAAMEHWNEQMHQKRA